MPGIRAVHDRPLLGCHALDDLFFPVDVGVGNVRRCALSGGGSGGVFDEDGAAFVSGRPRVGAVGLGLKRSPLYEKEIDFLISSSYGPGRYDPAYEEGGVDYPYAFVRWTENRNMEEYLRLVAAGKVDVGALVDREVEVENASEGYEALEERDGRPVGVLLRYPDFPHRAPKERLSNGARPKARQATGKVGVAVVGCGSFARSTHLPNLRDLSDLFHLRAVVSATGSNAKLSADHFGADYATTAYNEVLADPDIDAVIITTRHDLHARQVVEALNAGKHVYCEKPLALCMEELKRILACYEVALEDLAAGNASEPGNGMPVLMTGFNRRFSPAGVRLKELLAGRREPLMALYRVNATKLPTDHWTRSAEGGGPLVGEGCHMLDFFQFLVGEPASELSVHRLAPSEGQGASSDSGSVSLRYEDGSVCNLVYTSLGSDDMAKEYLELFAGGRSYILDDFKSLKSGSGNKTIWASPKSEKGHLESLRQFAAAVQGRQPWPMSLRHQALVAQAAMVFQGIEG